VQTPRACGFLFAQGNEDLLYLAYMLWPIDLNHRQPGRQQPEMTTMGKARINRHDRGIAIPKGWRNRGKEIKMGQIDFWVPIVDRRIDEDGPLGCTEKVVLVGIAV
jgi:hypothetical protein